jgi:hypothetical protein
MKIITIFFILLYSINTNGQYHKFENIKQILKSDDKNEIFKILKDGKYFLVDSITEKDYKGKRKLYKFINDNKEDTTFKIWISEFETQKNPEYLNCCFIHIITPDTNYKNEFINELLINDFKLINKGDKYIIKSSHPKRGIEDNIFIWGGFKNKPKGCCDLNKFYYRNNQISYIMYSSKNHKYETNFKILELSIHPKWIFKFTGNNGFLK